MKKVHYPYQVEAAEAVEDAWFRRGIKRPAIVIPTGGGKTTVFTRIADRHVRRTGHGRGRRVLTIAHRTELIEQAAADHREESPDLTVGIVKAGQNQTLADMVVGSVQTLRNPARLRQLLDVGLIIVDECFPAGTLVGTVPIEQLQPGDLVPSWNEVTGREVLAPVVRLMRKAPSALVAVTLESGRTIHCTPNHPILTLSGWCPAGMLTRGAEVVSFTHDATASGGVHGMCGTGDDHAQGQDRRVSQVGADVLQGCLPGCVGEPRQCGAHGQDESDARIRADAAQQPDGAAGATREDAADPRGDRAQAAGAGRQRQAGRGAATGVGIVSGLADRGDCQDGPRGTAVVVQLGHRAPDDEGRGGGGRGVALLAGAPSLRPAQGRVAVGERVAAVQVLESGRDGTYGGVCRDGAVYNIEVAGTHTYLIDGGTVVHNCHHGAAASYRMILEAFPDALVLGVTATFSRGDGAGLGEVFTDVVYQVPISLLQQQGFLVHARGRRVGVPNLDLSKVKTTGGEYQDGQLDAALSASLAPQAIVRAVTEHAPHDSAVVFTPGVHFAQVMHEAFDAAGFTSAFIHAGTPADERRLTLKRVESGDIQIINNCGILTEGTNIPRLKTCVPKPTKSGGLYVQMAGRVLRKFGDYTHALILDPVGATAMHSLNARVELFGEDAAAAMERAPCYCAPGNRGDRCICGRARCSEDCACGGGGPEVCGCERPEKIERVETKAPEDEEPRVDGELFSVEVDLFHASQNHWLVTQGGTWFLAAGERFIALVPGRLRATWSAVVMRREPGGGSRYLVRDVPDKGYAMAWAEDELSGRELRTARKERSWRAKAPTQAQRAEAERLGLLPPDQVHGGQLADLIAVEQASRRMDETVAIMRELQR